MKFRPPTFCTALLLIFPHLASALEQAGFAEDFEKSDLGKSPAGFMVMAGTFSVVQQSSNRVLELPGEPLDTFGLLFGPAGKAGISATARFLGTNKGRKFPTFGLSLHGVGGYRLQVSPAKKSLEIYRGDQIKGTVQFSWTSGAWTQLKLQTHATASGWTIQGKAWLASETEPSAWMLTLDEKAEPPAGRAGIWGSPYSGTALYFDDLLMKPAPDQ